MKLSGDSILKCFLHSLSCDINSKMAVFIFSNTKHVIQRNFHYQELVHLRDEDVHD